MKSTTVCTWENDWEQVKYRTAWFPFWIVVFCFCVKTLTVYLTKKSLIFNTYTMARKYYISKNIFKGIILCMLVPLSTVILWNGLIKGQWDRHIISICGTLYAATDMAGLVMVRNLALSTILHHVCVFIFTLVTLSFDYNTCPWIQSLVIYGSFASYTFLVNTYLGLRFVITKNFKNYWMFEDMKKLATVFYMTCIVLTWCIQYYYMFYIYTFDIFSTSYAILSHIILFDDIVLINHLLK